ncbi:MAG: NB-ARC domain-containing protein [Leptolyngbya sp. IPPAS B-1204]|nr:MAG: hypothetical protein EDM05_30030 [Leptolyngbya sp. IPPAS B-1204]
MTPEEALAVVESVCHNRLNSLQRTVFRSAWEDRSYGEIARQSGYELSYVKQTGSQLWQLLSQVLDEKVTKHNLQLVVRRRVNGNVIKADFQQSEFTASSPSPPSALNPANPTSTLNWPKTAAPPIEATSEGLTIADIETASVAFAPRSQSSVSTAPHYDWGDAVDPSGFYGRDAELATLELWIGSDRCRLVGIFGMGGIGKTSLSIQLARRSAPSFQYVIWRSLRNAPPLSDLLTELIQILSNQRETELPESSDQQISRLLHYLRQHRCLIVLDNGETVMRQGDFGGGYLPGYEAYDGLWQRLGQTEHQSTLVLTSREKPKGIAALEGKALPIRSLRLAGLSPQIGQALFNLKGDFTATSGEWQRLIEHYSGNPLALKMVAPVIQDLFDGQVASFLDCLQEGTSVFGDIQDLLAQQIDRLSPLEQQVMNWLAIARKPITLSQLRANFTPPIALGQLLEALASLERRCLIDKAAGKTQPRFTLQAVVMEYMTERLITQVAEEISAQCSGLNFKLNSSGQALSHSSVNTQDRPQSFSPQSFSPLQVHALIQTQVKDYIRETQTRLILKPIVERLLATHSLTELTQAVRQMLAQLRQLPVQQMGYVGGNLLNLLCQMGVDLTGWDFSGLTVWNAYLRGVNLHQVNLAGADLSRSVFTETFSQVLAVAFSPDGQLLATGDVNHEVRIWQVVEGKPLLSCRIHEGWIWSVAFSPDGKWLASSANRAVHLWDVQTGTCVRTLRGYSDRVFSVAFSPDGQLLATGSEDHLIRIWQVRTGQLLHTLSGHSDEVRSVAFSPVGITIAGASVSNLIASASYDGTIRLWDAVSSQGLRVLSGHSHWVRAVAFSPDGQILASGGADGDLKLWNPKTGRCLRSLEGHNQPIRTIAFSRDGRTLASGSEDRTVRLWNYRTGDSLRLLSGHSSWVAAVAFSPENDWLASGSEDQSVRLWDSQTGLCLRTLQGYSNGVWSVAFAPDGTTLASGSQDRQIRLWNAQTGALLGSLAGHTSWIWSVAFCPTQTRLASASEDQTICIWDRRTQQLLRRLIGHRDAILAVLYSPDGTTLWSASLDGSLKQWDSQTGECYQTLQGHAGGVWCAALSLDGTLLVSGSQDQTLKLWDAASGQLRQTLVGHQGWIRSVALSPDGFTLVSGSADGVIKLWNLKQAVCEQTIVAHQGPVLSLAFHPDGQTVASSSTDTTIKLWSLDGTCRHSIPAHDRWVKCLTYSPDGTKLASCSQDETIKLWQQDQLSTTLRIPRPYEGMTISNASGLTVAQQINLKLLGAVDSS